LRRFVVVGPSGSGKTTLGRDIAARLELPFIELDALHWGTDWTPPTPEDFRERVARALEGEAWVADGNYGKVRDVMWGRAQALVWLDYSLSVCLARLFVRTALRVVTRETLWKNNHETVRGQLSPGRADHVHHPHVQRGGAPGTLCCCKSPLMLTWLCTGCARLERRGAG
jgi:hypothetical protein